MVALQKEFRAQLKSAGKRSLPAKDKGPQKKRKTVEKAIEKTNKGSGSEPRDQLGGQGSIVEQYPEPYHHPWF